MMGALRQWIVGVTCAAMIGALAQSLMPEGASKKAGRLAVGLLLLLAAVKPLAALDPAALAEVPAAEAWLQAEAGGDALQKENEALVKEIIEKQTAAYISDKADALGMTCTAQVTYHYAEDGNVWPEAVVVRGEFTDSQKESLARILEAELAIPKEKQTFERVADR